MHVQPKHYGSKLRNLLHIAEQSFLLSIRTQGRSQAHLCDVFIEPDIADYHFFNFESARKIARPGYEAAKKALENFEG
jgi:predicted acylesterase/phospholipase RssA